MGLLAEGTAETERTLTDVCSLSVPESLARVNALPDAKARMIQLEARQAVAARAQPGQGDRRGPPAARSFDRAGYRVVTRSVSTFQPDRLLYDCIAVKLPGIPQQKK